MKNTDIRNKLKKTGVRQWEVAEALNYDESVFSRKMRHELLEVEKQEIFNTIETLSKKKEAI
jgi:predicted XRE-type DNA-binding protein